MFKTQRLGLFILAIAAVFVLIGTTARAGDGHNHDGHEAKAAAKTDEQKHTGHGDEAKMVTLEGEVLDMYCFMKHPKDGQGAGHAKCAKTCIRKGLPIGFLVGDEVYMIAGKNHESAADLVVDFAGMPASLTGTVLMHHGVKAIEVESIKKIDPAKKAKPAKSSD